MKLFVYIVLHRKNSQKCFEINFYKDYAIYYIDATIIK